MLTRRKFLLSLAGAGLALGSVAAYRGLHTLPPRDPAADERFRRLEEALLQASGVTAAARFVQLREPPLSVHVHELGSGDPVLFIHGGNSVAIGWLPLLTRLQSRFRLIVPDRPGCGLTSQFSYLGVDLRAHGAAFVGGVLEALDLPRAALIGNSMGGFFATSFALAHPERVSKLVLIGEPAGSAKMPVAFHRLVGTRGLNTLIYSTALRPPRGAADMRKSLARGHLVADPSRVPDPLLECLSEGARLPGAVQSWMTMVERAFEPAGAGLFARRVKLMYALRPELPRLAVPTLFLWGDRDPLGPPTLGGEMAALMPHGKLEVVSDAGHLPWLDQPDFCADRIASFLAAG